MATTKPRITVTLEPRAHEILSRLSAASGDSMSQIVASFVDLALPSLERVVVVLERARTAPEEVRVGMRAALDRADRELIPQLLDAAGQGDMFLASMVEHANEATSPRGGELARRREGSRPASAARPRGGSTPVPVTRGSGAKKQSQSRGRRGKV